MTVRFDPKGKYYTEVVNKIPVPVVIQTTHQRIHGNVFKHPGRRLIDELNEVPNFIAVTDALVLDGETSLETTFLTVHRDHIVWIAPDDEIKREEND